MGRPFVSDECKDVSTRILVQKIGGVPPNVPGGGVLPTAPYQGSPTQTGRGVWVCPTPLFPGGRVFTHSGRATRTTLRRETPSGKGGVGTPKVPLGGGHPVRVGWWGRRTPALFYLGGRGDPRLRTGAVPHPHLRAETCTPRFRPIPPDPPVTKTKTKKPVPPGAPLETRNPIDRPTKNREKKIISRTQTTSG